MHDYSFLGLATYGVAIASAMGKSFPVFPSAGNKINFSKLPVFITPARPVFDALAGLQLFLSSNRHFLYPLMRGIEAGLLVRDHLQPERSPGPYEPA